MKKYSFLLLLSLISTFAKADTPTLTGYNLRPSIIQAGKTESLKVIATFSDSSEQDVSSQFSLTYEDPNPAITEFKISPIGNSKYVLGAIAGSYQVKGTFSGNGSVFQLPLTINPGSPFKMRMDSGDTQKAEAGQIFAKHLKVKVIDAFGNPVEGYVVNWSVISGTVSLSQASQPTDAGGISEVEATMGLVWGDSQVQASPSIMGKSLAPYIFKLKGLPPSTDPSKLVFTQIPHSSQIKGIPWTNPVQIQLRDKNDIPVAQVQNISLTSYLNSFCTVPAPTGGAASGNTDSSGLASIGMISSASGKYFLKATSGTLESECSPVITVVEPIGEAAKLAITYFPINPIANVPMSPGFRIESRDFQDRLVSSSASVSLGAYTDSSCLSSAPGSLTNEAGTLSSGVTTISSVTYSMPGSIYLKVSGGSLQTACAGPIVVAGDSTAEIASLKWFPITQGMIKGQYWSYNPRVVLQNSIGSRVSAGSHSVSLSAFTDAACSIPASGFNADSLVAQSVDGFATWTKANSTVAGSIFLKATMGTFSSCSAAISVIEPDLGKIASLSWQTPLSGTAVAGENLSVQPVVLFRDNLGQPLATDGPVEIQSFRDSACRDSSIGLNAMRKQIYVLNGVAAFSGVKFAKSETVFIKASSSRILPLCSPAIAVSPAPAKDILLVSGDEQSGEIGKPLLTPSKVRVVDAFGNPVVGVSVSWQGIVGGGTLNTATTLTDALGETENTYITGMIIGTQSYKAFNNSLTGIKLVTFSAQGLLSGGAGGEISIGQGVQVRAQVGTVATSVSGSVGQVATDSSVQVKVGEGNSINVQGQ